MNRQRGESLGLIMLGAGRRMVIAVIISAALWSLFSWATSTPGGL